MRMNVRIEATAVIRTQTVQIPMVHTLACVVAVIVEMGTIALVSAFTGMRDNTQNTRIYIHAIMETSETKLTSFIRNRAGR